LHQRRKDLFGLDGRVAVVTGGATGIGRAMAGALADAGARVVLVSRSTSALERAVGEIRGVGGRAELVTADLADRVQLGRAADEIVSLAGDPDILVNAAAINRRPPMAELTTEDWDATLAINLTAPFLLGQRFGPAMASRGFGRIINLGSQQTARAFGNSGAYGVSKAAIAGLTRSQAEAWSPHGVCANTVVPGFVRTPMTEALFSSSGRPDELAARTMVGRNGVPDDFGGVAVFLASDASAQVTGQVLFVDGGFSVT
jgi:NAD(P)-dependent dehydrogenase (short-subunit alcohol dehydrogenase family)